MLIKNKKNKRCKTLFIFMIMLSLLMTNMNLIITHAHNSFWASKAIADFIHNKVDISENILNDNRYTTSITREEVAELIVAMYAISNKINKEDIPLKENPFKDTKSIDIQRAYSLGLIKGISKDEYGPTLSITREAFAAIIVRFLNVHGIKTDANGNLDSFIDKEDISKWAYNSMLYCVNQKIIEGFNKMLYPKSPISVEQALTILDKIALECKWFTPSKDSYYSGFFVPRDTELIIFTSENTSILIDWEKIKDINKLENDLYYMLNSNLQDIAKLNDLIQTIVSTQSYYANKNTQDFTKIFEIEGITFRIVSSFYGPQTRIYIDID